MKITTLQDLLNRAGASPALVVDGKFGPKSKAALIAFQARSGIRATGAQDERTLQALKQAAAGAATPAPAPAAVASDDVPPWMKWAIREIGEAEVPGPKSNARILEYREMSKAASAEDGEDGSVPWCAILVNAGLEETGFHGTRSALARSFETSPHFVKLDEPAVGAIVVFWRKSKSSGLGHVGFLDHLTADGKIVVLGGNQGDEVKRAPFPRKAPASGVIGYYWPAGYPLPTTGAVTKPGGTTDSDVSMV